MVNTHGFNPETGGGTTARCNDSFDSHAPDLPAAHGTGPAPVIAGIPRLARRAEGQVRRIDSPEEDDQVQPGEILVASQSNIGWTLLFPRSAAVVTDVGAPFSHAAIVARELGVPAVVGCGNATAWSKAGDRVRVHGTTGVVELVETT